MIVVTPVDATDCVIAVAISDRSPLTADDDIVVPGTKAALSRVKTPDELRGISASYRILIIFFCLQSC